MTLEDQVCTLEQAKKLKKLGVKQEGYFSWLNHGGDIYSIVFDDEGDFSAFTVAELGVMLPIHTIVVKGDDEFLCMAQDAPLIGKRISTEAKARAAMLICLLENKLITAEEINERLKL